MSCSASKQIAQALGCGNGQRGSRLKQATDIAENLMSIRSDRLKNVETVQNIKKGKK